MKKKQFELILLDGQYTSKAEPLRRRIALRIDGNDADVVTLKLDSDLSRKQQRRLGQSSTN